MVYCGLPSTSCGNCRAVKRRAVLRFVKKCDKATPSCGQCRRMGQECPGYRDATSLLFRNETTHVISRARARRAPRPARLPNRQAESSAPAESLLSSALSLRSNSTASTISSTSPRSEPIPEDVDSKSPIAGQPGLFGGDGQGESDAETSREQPILLSRTDESSSWSLSLSRPPALQFLLSPAVPSESLGDLGVRYFLANYVLPESGPSSGFFNYTAHVLTDPSNDLALLKVAFASVGLAGFANTVGGAGIMRKARALYMNALRMVNKALMQPAMARRDSTLIAVMVLGLFESITCDGDEALHAWTRHIDGATDLVLYRGLEQFRTPLGLSVFMEVISHLLTSYSRAGLPIPGRIQVLRAEAERFVPPNRPGWVLNSVHIEVMDLYTRIEPDLTEPFLASDWERLLLHAVEVDRQLEATFARLPAHWRYKVVHDPGASPEVVYNGIYHVYYDTWVAKVWDSMRTCRIMLCRAIHCLLLRECAAWAPHQLADGGAYAYLLSRVKSITLSMRDGILASVPQMLGFVRRDATPSGYGIEKMPMHTASPRYASLSSGTYLLLWHLYLAGSLSINSPETHAWVVNRLRAASAMTGIAKAQFMANAMESRPLFSEGLQMKLDASPLESR